jgi:hypothetical protein
MWTWWVSRSSKAPVNRSEAHDKTGALFGFERTARLSIQSAEVIFQAAQKFGQEDDITALTLMATVMP